ncbi:hypothetical protein J9303_03625 [Bacillaceae bacterium Marseille-Q3522]|nr:hypothetical protein [Bacillaceae bacterium Marseille-Q3522]
MSKQQFKLLLTEVYENGIDGKYREVDEIMTDIKERLLIFFKQSVIKR